MYELGLMSSVALTVLAFAFGVAFGWRLRAVLRDKGLEIRAQAADIDQLRAALTDSQKRCAQQADWLATMERDLTENRTSHKDLQGVTQAKAAI